MEHVVFFPAPDGTPAFRRVAGLDDAVRLVEHLRNVEGVTEVSVHALAEVPLAFKAYYRVEVPEGEAAPAVAAPVEAPGVAPVVSVVPDAPTQPVAEAPAALTVVADAPVVVAPDAPAAADVPEQPVAALAGSNGHAADGPASLGFFAS